MLQELWGQLGLSGAEMHLTVGQYGNTGSASIPITLDVAHREGKIVTGDRLLIAGFGGGMNSAASLITWSSKRPEMGVQAHTPLARRAVLRGESAASVRGAAIDADAVRTRAGTSGLHVEVGS